MRYGKVKGTSMIKNILGVAALVGLTALPGSGIAGQVQVSGSTTVASAILTPMESEIEASSGVDLAIVANGSSRGIDDLVSGRSNVAMISAPLDVTVAKINKKKPGSLDGKDLRAHQIGETRVAFVVHPGNPVKSLSLGQVSAILKGEIKNWSEVGGADMPIVIVAETAGGGVRSLVESTLIGDGSITGTLREFPNATQVPNVAAQLPPALGVAPFKAAGGANAHILETDEPISQPLILVTLGAPSEETQAVIDASRAAGS